MAPLSAQPSPCCTQPAAPGGELPGYRRWHFVQDFLDTPVGPVPRVKTTLERPDRLGAALVRLGVGRGRYRVAPGLYAVGAPDRQAPVLVTANYKLTFDAVRKELGGVSAWLLVLDTRGVNVWCAAGKKTFGTQELAARVAACRLGEVVEHRRLVVPQLGAAGVAAHEVRRLCGFRVVYGPVRAADIPAFLRAGMRADPVMRRVDFPASERVAVGLVEFSNERRTMLWLALALAVLAGVGADVFSPQRAWLGLWTGFAAYMLGFVGGNLLFPLLLPWLPGRAFWLKGALCGGMLGALAWCFAPGVLAGAGLWLGAVVAGAWYGTNFTGSTTFTSPSGVEKEMRASMIPLGAALVLALALWRAGLGGA